MNIFSKIIAFFMSIIALITGLFSGKKPVEPPAPSNPDSYTYYDYAYGSEERQIFDLALPENKTGTTGLVLFIHGGAWIAGNKDQYRDALKYATNLGIAIAAINYRYISSSVNMGMLMDDVSSALAKIKAVAAERGINLNKVLLTGASAGAHMSLLYAYKYADSAPITPTAVVSYCGPTDLTDPTFLEQNQLGDLNAMLDLMNGITGVTIGEVEYRNKSGRYAQWEALLKAYSPLYNVDSDSVATVIGHGRQDTIVPFKNATDLDAALTAKGVAHDFVIFPNSGHGLDQDPDCSDRMYQLLLTYARDYLK